MIEQNDHEQLFILVAPKLCSNVFELQKLRLQNFDDVASIYSNRIANSANIIATVKVFKNTFPPYFNEDDIPDDVDLEEVYPFDEDLEEQEQQDENTTEPLRSPETQKDIEREETEGNANPDVHKEPVE